MSAKDVAVSEALRSAHPPTVSVRRQNEDVIIVHFGLSDQAAILTQREASLLTLSLLSFSRGQAPSKEHQFTVTRSASDEITVQRVDANCLFSLKQVEFDALIEVLPLFTKTRLKKKEKLAVRPVAHTHHDTAPSHALKKK